MPFDTLDSVIGKVQQRVGTLPDYFLVQDWVVNAFRSYWNRIPWTWRRKQSQFLYYAPINTGTASVVRGFNTVTFSDAVITGDLLGRQIRVGGNSYPIRTLTSYGSSTLAYMDDIWSDDDQTDVPYEIYQAYVTVPDDFDSFLTIVDLRRNFQLDHWGHTAEELDRTDGRRAYSGNVAYWMVLKDYSADRRGVVWPVVRGKGTGNSPVSGGDYTGIADCVFTIEITGGGSTFTWRKDNGTPVTGTAIDATGSPQNLQDDVQIQFPVAVYTAGDVFAIRCTAAYAPGAPRYEAWPHIKADESRPYLYLSRPPDLTDVGAQIPRYVRGDVLVKLALAECCNWPGTADNPNPYNDTRGRLYAQIKQEAEDALLDLEREDQAREVTDLVYASWNSLPVWDSGYLAGHDIGYELNILDE